MPLPRPAEVVAEKRCELGGWKALTLSIGRPFHAMRCRIAAGQGIGAFNALPKTSNEPEKVIAAGHDVLLLAGTRPILA